MTDSTKKINDRSAKITCVETVAGKVRYNEDKAAENGSLIVEDGDIFTPEGFTTGTTSKAYIDKNNDAAIHAAKEPYNISAVNGGEMKNPLVFYNNNTEPVEFTLNITEPDALFKANKGTPTIVACGKSAVIVNIVCANKCALNNDNITVLVKDGVDLTINEKRSSSNGKLTVSGSGVTDGGIYSLNLADEGVSNRLTIKLTCTDDAGGRNSGTISSELRDSLGKTYREWSISRYNVDDENESVSYTYNLGQNIPTMFILKPDFGGGFTFRDYTVKLEASMNGKSILNQEKKSNSYPFSSSDNMYYYFSETGYARVAVADNDGNYEWKNYDSVRSAWNAAQSSNKIGLIQLTSPWLLDSRLILQDNKKVKIDLGGYIIRRNIDGLQDDGEVIKINGGAVLDIVDTCPDRSSCVAFKGGGIVGGRSSNGGGNIHIGGGTLNMTGGCIYDGRCNEDGGGIFLDHGNANLKNVVIKNCEAEKSTWVDNEGGAVYVMWEGSHLNLDNCVIDSCSAYDYGGAIMVDEGKVRIIDSVIKNCKAKDNDGGALNLENDTELYIRGSEITNCSACERGGAVFVDSEDGTWIIDTKITRCSSGDHGGGIYINDDNFYMEDIIITNNTAKGEGGGVFVESFDDIDIAGESIIKDNSGKNGRNDLTLDQDAAKAYLYNQGLEGDAYIKICSDDEGSETLTKVPMSKYQFDRYLHASLEGHYLEFDEDSEASEKNKAGKLNTEYEESLVTHLTKWDKAMAIIEITSMIYSGIWMITDGLVKLATGATFTAVVWGWATTLWAMGGIAGEEKDNGAQAKRDPSMIYQRKQYISGIYVGVGDTHAKAIAAVYAKIAVASGKTTLLSELDEVVFYSLGSKIGSTWYRRSGAKEEGEKYAYIGVTRTDSRSEAIYGLLKYYTDSDNNPEELTVNAKCRNLLTEEGRIVLDKNTTLSPEAFDHNYRSFKADYEYVNKKLVPEAHAKFEEGYDLALSNADKARMWEYIGAGVSIAFGLMAVAGGIMKIIELATYYDPEFEQIPRYIVDEKDITRQDESGFTIVLHNDYAYYKIVTCNRKAKGTSGDADHNWWTSGAQKNVDKYTEWGCGDYSDLNGDVGKGWLALYTETNPNHDPIEAGTFVVKFNDEVPSGYDNAIHLFGDNSAVNLNSLRWDFNADKTYVYYKTYNLHTITHGDVNKDGIINVKDVTEIRRYAAQYIELDETAIASADVTGDGSATISDATRIQSYLVDFMSLDELVVRNG